MTDKIIRDGRNYFYVDKGKTMHGTDERISGETHSFNGKIIERDMPCLNGYPYSDKGQTDVRVEGKDEVWDRFGRVDHPYQKYPEIMALYDELTK